MLLKKITPLLGSLILGLGLINPSFANWNWHTQRNWTNCSNGVCHRHVSHYTKSCSNGSCRVWKTHYNWVWHR